MTLVQEVPLTKAVDYYQSTPNTFIWRMKLLETRGNFLNNSLSFGLQLNFKKT